MTNLMGALAVALTDAIDSATEKALGRTHMDVAALAAIYGSPDEPIENLTKTLGLSQAGGSRLVSRLVDAGLLERIRSERDGRFRGLALTPAGKAEARTVLDARRSAVEQGLRLLTDEQRATLVRLLEPILEALTPDRWTAEHSCRLCDLDACPLDDCPIERAARRTEV